jgi:hypothetical protein
LNGAAEHGRDMEHVEQACRDARNLDALGIAAPRERRLPCVVQPHRAEAAARALPVHEVVVRCIAARPRRLDAPLADMDDAIGLGIGQGPQQHAAHRADHRRRCPDAEGKRHDRDDREARTLAQ